MLGDPVEDFGPISPTCPPDLPAVFLCDACWVSEGTHRDRSSATEKQANALVCGRMTAPAGFSFPEGQGPSPSAAVNLSRLFASRVDRVFGRKAAQAAFALCIPRRISPSHRCVARIGSAQTTGRVGRPQRRATCEGARARCASRPAVPADHGLSSLLCVFAGGGGTQWDLSPVVRGMPIMGGVVRGRPEFG